MSKPFFGRAMTFRRRITYALAVFSLIPALVVGLVSTQIAERDIIAMKESEYSDQFLNIRSNVNRIIEDINNLTLELYIDDALQKELNKKPDEINKIAFHNDLRALCGRFINDDSRVSMIGIYGNNGLSYGVSYTATGTSLRDIFYNAESVKKFLETNDISTINSWIFVPSTDQQGDVKYSLVNIKIVRDIETLEPYGYLVSALSDKFFTSAIPKHVSCDALIMSDQNGEIVLQTGDEALFNSIELNEMLYVENNIPSKNGSGIRKIDGEKYLVSYSFIPNIHSYLLSVIDYENLAAPIREITLVIVIVLLTSIGLFLFLATYVSKSILRPVNYLSEVIGEAEKGNLNVQFDKTSNVEVNELGDSFNRMVNSLNNNIRTIKEMAIVKQESDRQLLQAQINPHLIYNSLNSLKGLVRTSDMEALLQAINELSKFYQLSLNYGEPVIAINDELEHVSAYINVQNKCFGKSIDLQVDLAEETKQNVIVKMTLQPIVENALQHGLAVYDFEGSISIFEKAEGDNIILCVKDTGVGIKKNELDSLNATFTCGKDVVKEAYGLTNINSRLRYYFGKEYGLTINSELLRYTCVEIRLPKRQIGE